MEGLKRAAVFCLLICDGSFLLLKRSKEPNKGKLVPPGGKIEPFESPNDAVIREVKEETGLEINDITLCGILTETSPTSYNWISYIYVAHIQHTIIENCDEGEFHWIHKTNLPHIDTPATDMYIYQFVADEKQFIFHALFDETLTMLEMTDELSGQILFKKGSGCP